MIQTRLKRSECDLLRDLTLKRLLVKIRSAYVVYFKNYKKNCFSDVKKTRTTNDDLDASALNRFSITESQQKHISSMTLVSTKLKI